jgi:hypothetical protein
LQASHAAEHWEGTIVHSTVVAVVLVAVAVTKESAIEAVTTHVKHSCTYQLLHQCQACKQRSIA